MLRLLVPGLVVSGASVLRPGMPVLTVVFDHVGAHVVGPFEDLRSDVDQERIGGPTTKNHDFVDGVIVEEEGHGSAGAKGVGADFGRVEAEGFVSAAKLAGGPDLGKKESAGDPQGLPGDVDGVNGGTRGVVGDRGSNAGDECVQSLHGAHDRISGTALCP